MLRASEIYAHAANVINLCFYSSHCLEPAPYNSRHERGHHHRLAIPI